MWRHLRILGTCSCSTGLGRCRKVCSCFVLSTCQSVLLGPTSFQLYLGTVLVSRNLTKLPAWEAPTRGHVLKFFERER